MNILCRVNDRTRVKAQARHSCVDRINRCHNSCQWRSGSIQHYAIQCTSFVCSNTERCDTMRCYQMLCHVMQCDTMRCDEKWYAAMWCYGFLWHALVSGLRDVNSNGINDNNKLLIDKQYHPLQSFSDPTAYYTAHVMLIVSCTLRVACTLRVVLTWVVAWQGVSGSSPPPALSHRCHSSTYLINMQMQSAWEKREISVMRTFLIILWLVVLCCVPICTVLYCSDLF